MNWELLLHIGIPVFSTALGVVATLALERRQKLVAYLAHASAIALQEDNLVVHTHTVVVRNSGRKSAENVRVNHMHLPAFSVFPPNIQFIQEDLPGGARDIIFPKLVPQEQVNISYLYPPEFTWDQIQGTIKSDEGFAKIIQVLPTMQLSRWHRLGLWILILIGVVSLVYLLVRGIILIIA